MITKPLLKESNALLRIFGFNLDYYNLWAKIKATVVTVSYVWLTLEVLLTVVLKWGSLDSVTGLMEFVGFYQILSKIITFSLKRQEISEILYAIENFNYKNESAENITQVVFKMATNAMKSLLLSGSTASVLFLLLPIIMGTRMFPVSIYYPMDIKKSPEFEISYFITVLCSAEGAYLYMIFDATMASFVIHIIYELKHLSKSIISVADNIEELEDERNCLKKLSLLIDQHNSLLRCIKKLDGIYSYMFLNHFLSSILLTCFCLLNILSYGFQPTSLQSIICLTAQISQLFLYCLGGSQITGQCKAISAAAYECMWWSNAYPNLRKALIMIMQRANREELLTAGGIIPLDLNTFSWILKSALSFLSVAQALYQNP